MAFPRVKYPEIDNLAEIDTENYLVYVQEKRDGSNISIWFDGVRTWVSSRREDAARPDLLQNFQQTENGRRIYSLLGLRRQTDLIFFGELIPRGYGPTKIEGFNERPDYIVFDIYSRSAGGLLPPEKVAEICREYNVSMVETWSVYANTPFDRLVKYVRDMVEDSPTREGVVIKLVRVGENTVKHIFKMKRGVEKPTKRRYSPPVSDLGPPIPDEKIERALLNCLHTEFGGDIQRFKDKATVLPLLATYVRIECNEHGYSMPKGNKIYTTWRKFISGETA